MTERSDPPNAGPADPQADEPKVGESKADEPKADRLAANQPGTDQPNAVPRATGWRATLHGRSELLLCGLLLAVGLLVLTDAVTMDTTFAQRGPVGPKTVPYVVGVALLVVAVLLTVDVLRGGKGETQGGEDIDLDDPGDWRTVALLVGIFLAHAALIEPLGFPVAGALLFWGAAHTLGSRNPTRDPLIAAMLSVVTFLVFNNLLGVPLPGGPLMGVL